MSGFAPIVAERLMLRPLAVEEARIVVAYRRDPTVARFQGWGVVDPGEIERDLAAMQVRTPCDIPGPWFQLAVVERATGAIVGDLGVRVLGEAPDAAEIGYTIAPAYQRQGYATEAVCAMLEWLLGPRDLARVIAIVDGRNTPSIAVVENAGFHRVACLETKVNGSLGSLLTYERRQSRTLA
ncbi:MAG TPA: GNAT family N-acetyltransferase [Kofleriaceae bacterium]|nr:GNAT family N-acetyltransferase [Kofleriaceae bacterium]